MGILFILLIVGITAVFFLSYSVPYTKAVVTSPHWPTVTGEITESYVEDAGSAYEAKIHYSYVVADRLYENGRLDFGKMTADSYDEAAAIIAPYPVGQPVTVFYDPADVTHAVLEPGSLWLALLPCGLALFFVVALGWIGIPAHFPLIGGIVPNWLEHFMEPYIEYMGIHVAHPSFSWVPLLTSLVVALGGLAVGYVIYGKGLAAGQIDPLRKALGPIWWLFHRKYYVDEFYAFTILPFVRGLSKFLYWVDDVWVIDPIVDAIGRIGVKLSFFWAAFDRYVIDGVVTGIGAIADRTGGVLRNSQDGHVQVYLLVLAVSIAIWLLLEALPLVLTLV